MKLITTQSLEVVDMELVFRQLTQIHAQEIAKCSSNGGVYEFLTLLKTA